MTWRGKLGRVTINGRQFIGGSFRGVPFFVDGDERTGGRRRNVITFPFRDDPFVDDAQGKLPRSFTFSAYVIGDNYLAQRDALCDALEAAGPGELRHPQYGTKTAVSGPYTVSTSTADGGMARFTLDFAEAPSQRPVPEIVADPVGAVAAAADEATTASSAALAERYDVSGMPSFALESASTAITSAAAALEAALSPLATTAQELAELGGKLRTITDDADVLARTPNGAVDAIRDAITGMLGAIQDTPGAVAAALSASYAVSLGVAVSGVTATRLRERVNQVALTGAIRQTFATEAARLLPLATFASIEAATSARDVVVGQLDEQIDGADDATYPQLVMLRAELLRQVPGNAIFARVVEVERRTQVPSLLLAYQLYGAVDAEEDVIARNGVRHPGFMAGTFKVLSDG